LSRSSHTDCRATEDVTQDNLHALLVDLGYPKPPLARIIKQIAALAQTIAKAAPGLATKDLADALHAQAKVVEAALGADFALPPRDHYDRINRDDRAANVGGWGRFS